MSKEANALQNDVRSGKGVVNEYNSIFVDDKLLKYALNPNAKAEEGRAKAAAFKKYLGFELVDFEEVKRQVMDSISDAYAEYKSTDVYGDRYEVFIDMKGNNGETASVCTAWIFEKGDNKARLVSIYVKTKN